MGGLRYRWVITAVLALVAYGVGGATEARVVDEGGYFGWGQAALPLIAAAGLACLAAYQYRAAPRDARATWGGAVMPQWQGYGIAVLGAGWFALGAVTWFSTDLKSPFLVTTTAVFGVAHIAGGVAAVRRHGSLAG